MNAKKSLVNLFSDLASVEKVEKGTTTELEAGGRRQKWHHLGIPRQTRAGTTKEVLKQTNATQVAVPHKITCAKSW